jgi:uncharacterized protein
MRLDDQRPSDNVEDRRGEGGYGMPGGGGGGRGFNIPMGGGRGGFSFSTILLLGIAYLALKFLFGIDLLGGGSSGGLPIPGGTQTEMQLPRGQTDVNSAPAPQSAPGQTADSDAGKDFIRKVLGSTEDVWTNIFAKNLNKQYPAPSSACLRDMCNRVVAWRNRPWDRFIAHWTRRSILIWRSTKT